MNDTELIILIYITTLILDLINIFLTCLLYLFRRTNRFYVSKLKYIKKWSSNKFELFEKYIRKII